MTQPGLRVLSISGQEKDHLALRLICEDGAWEIHTAYTCREAVNILRERSITVAICERDLPDGCWKDLLNETALRERGAALIVASRVADDCLWAEVLNLGGSDVLAKPYEPREVVWSVTMAWSDWTSRFGQNSGAENRTVVV